MEGRLCRSLSAIYAANAGTNERTTTGSYVVIVIVPDIMPKTVPTHVDVSKATPGAFHVAWTVMMPATVPFSGERMT